MDPNAWFQKLVDHLEYRFPICPIVWSGVRTVELQLNAVWIPYGYEPVELSIDMFKMPDLNIFIGRAKHSNMCITPSEAEIDMVIDLVAAGARHGLMAVKANYTNLVRTLGNAQENQRQLEELFETI